MVAAEPFLQESRKMELKILVRLSSNQEQYLKTIRQNMMAAQLPTLAF